MRIAVYIQQSFIFPAQDDAPSPVLRQVYQLASPPPKALSFVAHEDLPRSAQPQDGQLLARRSVSDPQPQSPAAQQWPALQVMTSSVH